MRKLIIEEWMSLDGYVTDKDGKLDFFTTLNPEDNRYSDLDQLKFLDTIDCILLGRKTYELFVDFWPGVTTDTEPIADRLNETKKIVFSNSLQVAPWGRWSPAEIIAGNAVEAIKQLKNSPGKNMVMWGSMSLVQACLQANLVDELHIQLCPVLTGGGRTLFPAELSQANLNLVDVRHYKTGVVFLNYQPLTAS